MLQTQISVHLFQAAVFLFQFFHPLQLADTHPRAFGFPLIKRGLAEPMLAAQLLHRHSGFGFLQNLHDLAFRVFRFLHGKCSYFYFAMSFPLTSGMILREGYRSTCLHGQDTADWES